MILVLYLFSLFSNPQLGYELSQSTIDSFQKLLESNQEYDSKISKVPSFKTLSQPVQESNTLSIKLTDQHWDNFENSVSSLPKHVHAAIAKNCRKNSLSPDISETSSDRKFWHNLYTIHLELSK